MFILGGSTLDHCCDWLTIHTSVAIGQFILRNAFSHPGQEDKELSESFLEYVNNGTNMNKNIIDKLTFISFLVDDYVL